MKRITTTVVAILLVATMWAQAPEKMSYQAVIRNASNVLVATQGVGIQVSILKGGASGTPVFVETHNVVTNINGLVSLEIGTGTLVSGNFTTINWGADTYFIQTETDPTTAGGTNYTITGTTQLMSVPYALHAKTAESITGTVNYTETDPTFTVWNKSTGISITESQISDLTHTVDTDTHIDSTGIAALGYIAGVTNVMAGTNVTVTGAGTKASPYMVNAIDTHIDSTGIATLGYIAGVTNVMAGANVTVTGAGTKVSPYMINAIDTHIDSTGIAALGYIAGVTKVTGGTNVTVTGAGTKVSPYMINAIDKFYLGQDTLGGIVYYIYKDATGIQHGLIVNKGESIEGWQGSGTETQTNAARSWDGAYNTALMTSSDAATYVNSFGIGWYLPSIDELSFLWHNRYFVNKALNAASATLLSNINPYWSSTEYNTLDAMFFYFGNGNADHDTKPNSFNVRAVKAF